MEIGETDMAIEEEIVLEIGAVIAMETAMEIGETGMAIGEETGMAIEVGIVLETAGSEGGDVGALTEP